MKGRSRAWTKPSMRSTLSSSRIPERWSPPKPSASQFRKPASTDETREIAQNQAILVFRILFRFGGADFEVFGFHMRFACRSFVMLGPQFFQLGGHRGCSRGVEP